MFLIYPRVLIRPEIDFPCGSFLDRPFLVIGNVSDIGLNVHLVVHVLHQFVAGIVNHLICLGLITWSAPVEILHIGPILTVSIPRISNASDILTNVVPQ